MFTKLYLALGSAIVAGYLWISVTGQELGATERQLVPQSVRQSPGGYRSFHFWHSGYSGGK